jgi:hypothetical protein
LSSRWTIEGATWESQSSCQTWMKFSMIDSMQRIISLYLEFRYPRTHRLSESTDSLMTFWSEKRRSISHYPAQLSGSSNTMSNKSSYIGILIGIFTTNWLPFSSRLRFRPYRVHIRYVMLFVNPILTLFPILHSTIFILLWVP